MATHSTVWTGILSSAETAISVGQAVVIDSDGYFRPATTANRASYGRSRGIAKTAASGIYASFEYQVAGILSDADSGIADGTAGDWVIVDADGNLERDASPDSGEDVIGRCPHTNGDVQVAPGVWDSTNTSPGGGGGSAAGATDTVQTTNGSGTLTAATNVKAGNGYIAIGANPAEAGAVRLSSNDFVTSEGDGAEYELIGLVNDVGGDRIEIGNDAGIPIRISAGAADDITAAGQAANLDVNAVQFFGTTPDVGGGVNVVGIAKAAVLPTAGPADGVAFYVDPTSIVPTFRREDTDVIIPLHGSYGTCTLEMFGAVGDGVTSDQTAFAAARTAIADGTYSTLLLGAKTYLITGCDSSNPWPMGGNVVGCGSASVLKTATDGPVFLFKDTDAADRAKNTLFAHFRVEGNSTGTNQNAIEIGYLGADGCERVRVMGCTFNSLGGRGVSVYAPLAVGGAQVVGCKFYSCLYGVYAVEQVNIDGCQFNACTTGVYAAAGNVNITGGALISCTTGLHVAGGGNDGHGTANGVQFLHCTTPLRFGAVANGHLIDGCLIYEGTILFDGSNAGAIVFQGGLVDATVYTLVGKSRWLGVTFDLSYYSSSSTTGGDNEFTDCRDIDGTVPSWIASLVQVAFTYPSDANATLTAQQSRAEIIDIQAGVISVGRDLTSAHAPAGAKSRQIVVRNNTAQTVTYKWSSGTGVAIASGTAMRLGSDGTNAIQIA
jgi:hypothetical protein